MYCPLIRRDAMAIHRGFRGGNDIADRSILHSAPGELCGLCFVKRHVICSPWEAVSCSWINICHAKALTSAEKVSFAARAWLISTGSKVVNSRGNTNHHCMNHKVRHLRVASAFKLSPMYDASVVRDRSLATGSMPAIQRGRRM